MLVAVVPGFCWQCRLAVCGWVLPVRLASASVLLCIEAAPQLVELLVKIPCRGHEASRMQINDFQPK
jgi:hypothetical protein